DHLVGRREAQRLARWRQDLPPLLDDEVALPGAQEQLRLSGVGSSDRYASDDLLQAGHAEYHGDDEPGSPLCAVRVQVAGERTAEGDEGDKREGDCADPAPAPLAHPEELAVSQVVELAVGVVLVVADCVDTL